MTFDPENDTAVPPFYRTIKTFVLRAGRMTPTQQRDYEELAGSWCLPVSDKPLNYTEIFGNTNPVTVEIGFGMGKATALIAEAHPNVNYLGLEVHRPGIGKLLGEIRRRGLQNVYIIEHDALEVLTDMIPDASVNAFHIFFPDPWPKKKHHKRRLVQRPRTDLLAQKLTAGGYLYMATDWEPYAQFALEQLAQTPGLRNAYGGYAPHQPWRPETRFEEKGKVAERAIRELYFIKEAAGSGV
ncbi:tRNA (guanosine(46)-N7)-methyltransferase TrmB [Treponema brennaborense]|uniref:tRNA (guanine-N(7)-)-methyltransferase n=1 Tax=Treponema brennaborense (strain DSM 12168 / CIP 105900 / DD5/3) TaxID=906968 RepID=F4LLH4_TREBD|nr:tRNA (guanosine(46)-N7)-methyltransferase TrmB [Treponema brennaborense]AEE16638.1 tRNA (guanine-N(7)-)-methyltransferase [Treponema brennaborense DSM 12168]